MTTITADKVNGTTNTNINYEVELRIGVDSAGTLRMIGLSRVTGVGELRLQVVIPPHGVADTVVHPAGCPVQHVRVPLDPGALRAAGIPSPAADGAFRASEDASELAGMQWRRLGPLEELAVRVAEHASQEGAVKMQEGCGGVCGSRWTGAKDKRGAKRAKTAASGKRRRAAECSSCCDRCTTPTHDGGKGEGVGLQSVHEDGKMLV